MELCVVAGIIHGIMCCCRDYPWDYVLLQGLSMGLCVVAGMEGQPENENLLSAPVKLSPGWEDRTDKSAEELNFKPTHEEGTPLDR